MLRFACERWRQLGRVDGLAHFSWHTFRELGADDGCRVADRIVREPEIGPQLLHLALQVLLDARFVLDLQSAHRCVGFGAAGLVVMVFDCGALLVCRKDAVFSKDGRAFAPCVHDDVVRAIRGFAMQLGPHVVHRFAAHGVDALAVFQLGGVKKRRHVGMVPAIAGLRRHRASRGADVGWVLEQRAFLPDTCAGQILLPDAPASRGADRALAVAVIDVGSHIAAAMRERLAGLHDGFISALEPLERRTLHWAAIDLARVYITAQLALAVGQRLARIWHQGLNLDLPLANVLGVKVGQALQRYRCAAWRV